MTDAHRSLAKHFIAGTLLFVVAATASGADRVPVPDEAAVEASLKTAKQLFVADYTSRDPARFQALIGKLLENARQSSAGSADQYALFNEAARLSVTTASDITSAFETIDELARTFEVSPVRLKLDLLEQVPGRDLVSRVVCSHHAIALANSAAGDSQPELVEESLEVASRMAKLARATGLTRFIVMEEKRHDGLVRMQAEVEAAQKALAEFADPTKSQTVGEYLALHLNDWERGLPHLARGDDAVITAAAKRELSMTSSGTTPQAADMEQLSDDWLKIAAKFDGVASANVADHGTGWLRRAFAAAKGLERTRLERKLEESSQAGPDPVRGRRGEIIAADIHRGNASPNGSKDIVYSLNSPYPVELRKSTLVCGISMDDKPGWTTDGQIEVSFGDGEWKPVANWNAGLVRAARRGHQISFAAAPQNPTVSSLQVRFRLSKGHSLYISQVYWMHQ